MKNGRPRGVITAPKAWAALWRALGPVRAVYRMRARAGRSWASRWAAMTEEQREESRAKKRVRRREQREDRRVAA